MHLSPALLPDRSPEAHTARPDRLRAGRFRFPPTIQTSVVLDRGHALGGEVNPISKINSKGCNDCPLNYWRGKEHGFDIKNFTGEIRCNINSLSMGLKSCYTPGCPL